MPIRSLLISAVSLVAFTGGNVVAASPDEEINIVKTETGTSYVSLMKGRTGRSTLVIEYPWKVHQMASVELRLVTADNPENAGLYRARPLLFVKNYLHGKVIVDVHHCRDRSFDAPTSRTFTEDEIEFEILGGRNTLGRPSVCVARRIPNSDPVPGASVAYCLLPSWSRNGQRLHLDLPVDYFAEPGKLYVWFIRDRKVLWEEVEDWPGIGAAKGRS